MNTFSLHNGRIIDPASGLDTVADLHVVDGKIADSPSDSAMHHDVDGKWVLPGLVDIHGRLAASGRSITSCEHELRTALQFGITTLCVTADTDPVLDNVAALEQLSLLSKHAHGCRVRPVGALTQGLKGEQLAELATLSAAGCIAHGDLHHTTSDIRILLRAMTYARNFDLTLFVQPNDPWLAANGCVHDGPLAQRMGLPGVPASAESIALSIWLELCRETGTRLHFNKISSQRGVEMIRQAKTEGLPVTADTSLNHAYFDDSRLAGFDNRFKLWPPLRGEADRSALREALRDGTLDAICSDHCRHSVDDTLAPLQSSLAGGTSFDALLPAVVALGQELDVPPKTALGWITSQASGALRLGTGSLGAGTDADICVFDPETTWVYGDQVDQNRPPHSPWTGQQMRGNVCAVSVNGVYNETRPK